jgi:TPR repeat protein
MQNKNRPEVKIMNPYICLIYLQDAEGQYFLGICYENGWGVDGDDEEAARFYEASAEAGHDGAMYNLAAFHEYGLGGGPCFFFVL